MQLKSVETTPNPNSMKLNLLGTLGATVTYTLENKSGCPEFVDKLLGLDGVKSVFACNDFITLNRDPRADWRPILEQAAVILGRGGQASASLEEAGTRSEAAGASLEEASASLGGACDVPAEAMIEAKRQAAQKEGQVQVFVQTFRGIPIQVKAIELFKETRISLGDRFNEAALSAQAESGADYLKERYWADHGVRYGPLDQVANEVADELRGMFDQSRLAHVKDEAPSVETLALWLEDEDWHRRLAAVQVLSNLANTVALLAVALKDSNPQVRRLAAAALGTTGSAEAVPPLADALVNDKSIGVRRTAGDALSDLGDASAEPSVCVALSDPSKLVRWRAARLLSDIGSTNALPFLMAAADDPEFEVRLEIEAALQRIRGGGQGLGPAWKRIIGQA